MANHLFGLHAATMADRCLSRVTVALRYVDGAARRESKNRDGASVRLV